MPIRIPHLLIFLPDQPTRKKMLRGSFQCFSDDASLYLPSAPTTSTIALKS
jgi:hypothetical protein